ncbi:aryl hydrocarbon receptor isoform X1 [Latimeria chalumnae]|uniref:aryl hydrocarbon receptor isoform X1 n=2 Tax=Latimeria chalumnae TaxID=7897 RepID=UPI0006D9009C|nr:PREDICTED: aryl hydrocarbon receptor-like isoform X2 [Latimeria chalumnae]|eukprot:XP_014349486.1 PREDICTED: aryl hydrocarbon receptor-like isoform X2 [Latimeria chalumnae]
MWETAAGRKILEKEKKMLNSGLYAGRKRKRPVPKIKPQPLEEVKSNPSKRHRDRLNAELEKLSRLLPFSEDVITKLDKLSVLRLSVSYLRAKSFFGVALQKQRLQVAKPLTTNGHNTYRNQSGPQSSHLSIAEGELLLQTLNGFLLVVTSDGTIFYSSTNIQDYLGFYQSDIINQSVYELVHTEDREEFRRQLHWALNPSQVRKEERGERTSQECNNLYQPDQLPPENSSFLNRNFVCRFRCLLDSSSGFLALHFHGKLKFLHGQNKKSENGTPRPPQLALFCIAVPVQPPAILEIRTKSLIFKTKHKMDFTPLSVDSKGKVFLGWSEMELKARSGYQFVHFEDMMYCADNHVRMMKTGDSGPTIFRLLTKDGHWAWVNSVARIVYKDGKADFIIATQRILTDAEGEEHLQKRAKNEKFLLPGRTVLYDSCDLVPQAELFYSTIQTMKNEQEKVCSRYDPSTILGAMIRQDRDTYMCRPPAVPSIDACSYVNRFLSCSVEANTQDKDLGIENNGSWLGSADHPVSSISLDIGIAEMLKKYGLNEEDLEIIQKDETISQIELDDLTTEILNNLSPENILSRVDAVVSSLDSFYGNVVPDNNQDNLSSCESNSEQSGISVSPWSSSCSYDSGGNFSPCISLTCGQFSPQEPKQLKQELLSSPPIILCPSTNSSFRNSCSRNSSSCMDPEWQFPCNTMDSIDQQATISVEGSSSPLVNQTSVLNCHSFQHDHPITQQRVLNSQVLAKQSILADHDLAGQNTWQSQTITQKTLLNASNTINHNMIYQPSWPNQSPQTTVVKPCWSQSYEDEQESNMINSTAFLPKGVMNFVGPDYGQNVLCREFSWASVQ